MLGHAGFGQLLKIAVGVMCLSGLAACQTHKATNLATPSKSVDPISHGDLQTVAADGVRVFGDYHADELSEDAQLIMLFHQGGSNVRGEYSSIVPWLNENGFRVMAWDLRSGGEIYGSENRTRNGLAETDEPIGYCDAYPDMQAALDYATKTFNAKPIIWGSSYSAALIFKLARDNPDAVAGLIAFSPASGGPMAACKAALFVEDVSVPMNALSPASEMERDSVQEQFALLTENGVDYSVIENGVHGSSMLVDTRTEADMSEARKTVLTWLKSVSP